MTSLSIAPLMAALALSACAAPQPQLVLTGTPLPEGSAAALLQPVQVGELIVTPQEVIEDSRCPINARCVWAGRLIVRTRIASPDWRDTADLALGEPYSTHGHVIALTSAEPGTIAGQQTPPEAYRFTYELR